MKLEQQQWTSNGGWTQITDNHLKDSADLVFAFGGRNVLSDNSHYEELRALYPNAKILSGSTSGEILDVEVSDDTISVTAVDFEHTDLKVAKVTIKDAGDSYNVGEGLAKELLSDNLAHIFVLSDGLKVNGSELVKGFNEVLPEKITVTGGLAGDKADFEKTLVGIDAPPSEGNVIAIGFYSERLKIGYGSIGGWDSFGPERKVTKSKGNVLYELDGQSALELYKTYLGDQAEGLPGTGLLFPLSIKENENDAPIVRTLLAVDEGEQSMTFAGDIPEGSIAQLMKANFDKLIDGAYGAAENSQGKLGTSTPDLALLISCVGRKLVLGQRIEEEVEEVRSVFGDDAVISGFYSYGEISPLTPNVSCELHNQTMTITTFTEE